MRARDKNAKFFYRQASQLSKKNLIRGLVDENGTMLANLMDMAELAKKYFSNLFSSSTGLRDFQYVLSRVDRCTSYEDNNALTTPYVETELVEAIRSTRALKAPRTDGFPAMFFQNYWHIVGRHVSSFYLGLLNDNEIWEKLIRPILYSFQKPKIQPV